MNKPENMYKKYVKLIFFMMWLIPFGSTAYAQNASDVLRYSLQYPENDPVTMVMPGVSDATDFGAYQENPASMALVHKSYFSIGLSDRYVNEKGFYIRNSSSGDDNQANISHAGFVYKVPTRRGKLTIGAGYSQSHDFNRALSVHGRNNVTSINDFYNSTLSSDDVYEAAFQALAVDYKNENTDETTSIFKVNGPYRGINQRVESRKRGALGDYSAFVSDEIAKNLIVGASIGVTAGTYKYRRDFLEVDSNNDYTSNVPSQQDQSITGVDNILSHDKVDENFTGFSLRLGALYQVSPHVNIGAAYQLKNVLHIDEKFNTTITNTLDDGSYYQDDAPAELKYKVVRPARINFGLTAKDLAGFTFSASGQRVNYSEGRIRYKSIQLENEEQAVNSNVQSNLDDVINLRAGLQYKVNPQFTPRIGYAYYPSPVKNAKFDRNFYSAGFSSQISNDVQLNVGAQLGRWKSDRVLYSTPQGDEIANENVNHWNVMAGLKFGF